MISKLKSFIQANKLEFLFLTGIVILALFLRLHRIDQYLTFLGDEGRDVRIVRDLIRDGNLVFIGPQTSIGNMYLGPLYYYMMAPFLWLWNLSPVGPAVMVALLSTVAIVFTWHVTRTWFGDKAALIAALLFAISPVSIIYSHSSWNPNPMPFFALLSIWSIWRVWRHQHFKWLPVAAFSLAAALQMHYLGLLLIPTLGLFWLLSVISIWKKPTARLYAIRYTLYATAVFMLLMSPLVLFDLKHNGQNFNAFKDFFTDRQTTVNFNPLNSDRFGLVADKLTSDLVLGTSLQSVSITSIILAVFLIFFFIRTHKSKREYALLLAWIIFGYLGLVVYKQHVYAHYFGFIWPAIYILLGTILARLLDFSLVTKLLAVSALAYLIYISAINSPLNQEPNRQLHRTQEVAEKVMDLSGGEPFNFALIAKQNYDESYRYFLENKEAPLVRGEDAITDQLIVVCENGDECQPEGNPQWQIAVFGPSKVVEEYQIDYIKLYRLVHR